MLLCVYMIQFKETVASLEGMGCMFPSALTLGLLFSRGIRDSSVTDTLGGKPHTDTVILDTFLIMRKHVSER